MVNCEILKIAIYLVNIALVDEKVKSLMGNRGRSFRIHHFQQPTMPSSGCSIDDVTSVCEQMQITGKLILECIGGL